MSSEEESCQAYKQNGKPAQRAITKLEALSGRLHGAVDIWMWRNGADDIEVLLQRRSPAKRTWPNHLDISVAGHMKFGETPIETAVREVREEIGFELDTEQLRLLFVNHGRMTYGEVIENELLWVYGYEIDREVKFSFDDGEVAATSWVTLASLRRLIAGHRSEYPLVPHGEIYFNNLLAEVVQAADI